MDYLKSGVNIQKAEGLVEWLKTQKNKHYKERIVSGLGGYASLFRMDFPEMKEPCIASSTDGVGTKLKLALEFCDLKPSPLRSLGQDLVAMCVNDLLCVGAKPLFFLDYYACGKLDDLKAQEFLTGVKKACDESLCALIGGETAEMPGLYKNNDFDCAGFASGVVDRPKILGSHKVKAGDDLIALPSSGFHSNGYSLLRKVFKKDLSRWTKEFLKPTALYAKVFSSVLKKPSYEKHIHALAHITGGGMDNILRVVPRGSNILIKTWPLKTPFLELKKRTRMSWRELLKTVNCGVGMVIFSAPQATQDLIKDLKKSGCPAFKVGELKRISKKSRWTMDFKNWEKLL